MGSCCSTVLPHGLFGAPRRKDGPSPKESMLLPKDEGNSSLAKEEGNIRLPDDVVYHVENKPEVPPKRRKALLVGISYSSPSNTWSPLDGPHGDVDRFKELLLTSYGYRPEDIVVLKDLPELPDSHPTRVNMIRELKALVSGATPGDRFTFFYSGHSDQQDAKSDMDEEDGLDEMLIASDEKTILDNELRDILVVPLPVGCTLLAVLDTCHSGTMLDLPHHHCNNVYVPWQSKGERRTLTFQNANVRSQATDFANTVLVEPPSLDSAIEDQWRAMQARQFGTQFGEGRPADQDEPSRGRQRGSRLSQELMVLSSQPRFASPERFVCDGWCKHSKNLHANVLSLSACSDLQRAWEGPKGSLTTVLCNYLKKHSRPSYSALMSHINFQLHDNALALHEYTRHERKKAHNGQGDGFDGELDNFQQPELSSLERLNMNDTLQL